MLGIKQPHVSARLRISAGNFSVGRLMEFLTALGQDVRIAGRSRHGSGWGRWWWWFREARVSAA